MNGVFDPQTGLYRWDPRPFPEPPQSLVEVLDGDPSRLAMIDGDRTWTYGELDTDVARLAGRLVAAGFVPGDRLLWSTPNCAEQVVAFLATQRLGVVWTAVSARATAAERDRVIALVEPKITIVGLDELDELDGDAEAPPVVVDPNRAAAIGFTSGTSGHPKAVVHSQHGLIGPAQVSRSVEPPQPGERIGTPLALTVLNMMVLGPLSAFVRGTTAVIMRRTDPDGFVDEVERHRVTRAFVVPPILHDLLRATIDPNRLRSLDRVIAGAAGARSELLSAFTERFGIRPTLSYGLTEAPTGVVREALTDPIGSGRGFPLPHVELTLDDDGEIRIGATSEGPWAGVWTPMIGYWGDPESTRAALVDGRLRTGDVGVLDEDGAVRVIGRRDELINRGGELIAPREVEAALEGLPAIEAAAVVGLPDDRLGEAVAALVVLAPGAVLPDIGAVLPRSRVPAIVRVAAALPRTGSGKVDPTEVRRVLLAG